MSVEGWEIASYVVTVIGLPLAIGVFLLEQRRERRNEEDEVYQLLSDAYNDFLRVAIDNPDLHLRSNAVTSDLSPEQQERMLLIFDMLISLLERGIPDRAQRQHDAGAAPPLEFMGRLHARVATARRFLLSAAPSSQG